MILFVRIGAPISGVLNKRQIYSLPWDSRLPPRCTFVVRSLLVISSRDCREADSRDTSPRHACLGEVSRKIWLHDFAINNNGGSVPVIFISLDFTHLRLYHLFSQPQVEWFLHLCYLLPWCQPRSTVQHLV